MRGTLGLAVAKAEVLLQPLGHGERLPRAAAQEPGLPPRPFVGAAMPPRSLGAPAPAPARGVPMVTFYVLGQTDAGMLNMVGPMIV